MKNRILFYVLFAALSFCGGYFLYHMVSIGNAANVIYFTGLVLAQYFLSTIFFKATVLRRLVVTIVIWIISYVAGMTVMVQFLFNKRNYPGDLFGWMAFVVAMIICYEIYTIVGRKSADQ